jgi:hypothetical protein
MRIIGSHGSLLLQVRRDFGELGESGLEVFDDLGGDDVGIRLALSSRLSSLSQKEVEVEFVAAKMSKI